MQPGRSWIALIVVAAALHGLALRTAAQTALTHAQALAALEHTLPLKRAEGITRLAEIGTMAETERLARRLADDDEQVRSLANAAMWQIWGRSGDPAIDALFKRGVAQMEAADFDAALATFTDIIRRKPSFAEGWNKRATILFLLGQHEASLHDCREVLKRNALHFGALSGMGQIYLQLGDLDQALLHFQRALKVNPHLPGAAEAVRLIEQHQPGSSRRLTT